MWNACVNMFIMTVFSGTGLEAQSSPGNSWSFDVLFEDFGLGVDVGYKGLALADSVDTIVHAQALGTYMNVGYFRTPSDAPYDGSLSGYDDEDSTYAWRAAGTFSLELDQGLLWNEREKANGLEIFLAYNLRYENYLHDHDVRQLLFDSARMERDPLLYHSVIVGVEWKDVDRRNPHGLLSGTASDVSVEWGPEWLFNTALEDVDFIRLNWSGRAFLPLFDVDPEAAFNKFSVYACFFLSADYCTGESVPLSVRQTFGGKYPRKGLGYAVRGLEYYRYDTPFKTVANLEVRANLPALCVPEAIPGIYVFLDCGYYDFIDFSESGLVASTGFGVFFSLGSAFTLTLETQVLLNDEKVNGDRWTPVCLDCTFHF